MSARDSIRTASLKSLPRKPPHWSRATAAKRITEKKRNDDLDLDTNGTAGNSMLRAPPGYKVLHS